MVLFLGLGMAPLSTLAGDAGMQASGRDFSRPIVMAAAGNAYRYSLFELASYIAVVLGVAALLTTLALMRQRRLLRRIAGQGQELAEQRSLLAALYDKHPMATLVLEFQQSGGPILVSYNSQAQVLLGLDPTLSLGKKVKQLTLSAEGQRLFDEALIRWRKEHWSETWELSIDETHRVFENTLLSLGGTETGGVRVCLLIADITRRRLVEHGVAQARRLEALGEMVGGIAHEFNNLLMPIVTTVEIMRDSCPQPSERLDDLQVIENAATRAAELTRRLLGFGRKGDTTLQPVQVSDVVANCLALIRSACDRRIEWEMRIPTGLPSILFNLTDLNQILLNLIINARDALQEKLAKGREPGWIPRIAIAVEELPVDACPRSRNGRPHDLIAWQKMTVEDSGPGIPPGIVDRIFEPFFTTKEVGKGTGLGLATVWQLVTEANGTVTVESTVGTGTRFHVFLPRYQLDTAAPHEGLPKISSSELIRRKKILLVEDEPLLARSCGRGLNRLGHEVTIAADGAEAWHLFETGKGAAYDVLVVDFNMPRMNGLELIQRVRTSGYEGRIFLMSGRIETLDSASLFQWRVECMLVKPFMISTLAEAIENPPAGQPERKCG